MEQLFIFFMIILGLYLVCGPWCAGTVALTLGIALLVVELIRAISNY